VVEDFEDGVGEPFAGDLAAVVKLQREQHLESPPVAAHQCFFPIV
jgi:hypothetical protein